MSPLIHNKCRLLIEHAAAVGVHLGPYCSNPSKGNMAWFILSNSVGDHLLILAVTEDVVLIETTMTQCVTDTPNFNNYAVVGHTGLFLAWLKDNCFAACSFQVSPAEESLSPTCSQAELGSSECNEDELSDSLDLFTFNTFDVEDSEDDEDDEIMW